MLKPFFKSIAFWALTAIFLGSLGLLGYYRHKQNQWLEYKKQIESQKAPEATIRIVEGWNSREIGEYLEKEGIVEAEVFSSLQKNYDASAYAFLESKPAGAGLEGFLFPDTYRVYKPLGDGEAEQAGSGVAVIKKMLDNFNIKIPANAETLTKAQSLTFYEAVILASIVEKETGRNAITNEQRLALETERKIVAGIFLNRLNANMALESDATINYVTGKNEPSPSFDDLEKESPYNTYKNRGLPPTPIANPSLSSIMAVLEPTKTDYFYFLHKQPSGEPVYSKTFEEHVQNKFKYLK